MKTLLILFLFATVTTICFAQTTFNDDNFVLLLNGKQFHAGDTVQKRDLTKVDLSVISIVNNQLQQQYQPVAYEWIVYVKDSNTIWKGNCATNPTAASSYNPHHSMATILETAKPGDLVFLDAFEYSYQPGDLPKQFAFVVQ